MVFNHLAVDNTGQTVDNKHSRITAIANFSLNILIKYILIEKKECTCLYVVPSGILLALDENKIPLHNNVGIETAYHAFGSNQTIPESRYDFIAVLDKIEC